MEVTNYMVQSKDIRNRILQQLEGLNELRLVYADDPQAIKDLNNLERDLTSRYNTLVRRGD